MKTLILLIAGGVLAGCAGRPSRAPMPSLDGAEAVSLLGEPLVPVPLPDATRITYEARRDSAAAAVAANPNDPDALIWLGRRTAYLGRYREAIATFTRGIERWPEDARFYRHRGHRYITIRQFPRATRDFERAAELVRGRPDEIEPDGLPNARGIPTSTLQSNIFYHLGLSYWLRGDARRALRAYQEDLAVARNPDTDVAVRYWLYLTQRRLGDTAAARATLEPVTRELAIIENGSYHRLLLVFKGLLPEDSLLSADGLDGATTAFGLGAWHEAQGHRARALELYRRARAGNQWAAFGFIAAEAALARLR